MRLRAVQRAFAVLVGLSLVATACGGDDEGPGTPGSGAKGKRGGTLRLLGQGDITNLDTATSYELIAWGYIMRAMTRQLVTYPNTEDKVKRDVPVPDVAAKLPEITDGGRTYTFTLKKDVEFAPPVNRAIVGNDFIVGIKRLCDPNNPSGGLGYFTDTIVGLTDFCAGLGKVKTGNTAAVKSYIENNRVAGMSSPEDNKLIFKLTQPAGDFLNLLATPFASPVAGEHALKYIADSKEFRQNFVGSGPYTLDRYEPEKFIHMKRNENQKDGDEIRRAWVDRIEITTNSSDDTVVQQQIETGEADMYFGGSPPVATIETARNKKDARLHVNPNGCIYYTVMNLRRPQSPGGKALQDVRVRQALNYAWDKTAHLQVYGGETAGTPTGQILTSPIIGYDKFDPYETPGNNGDPDKAKALLTAAGFPNGITFDYLYRPARKGEALAASVQESLKKSGITLNLKKVLDKDFYSQHLVKPDANDWDFSSVGWCPDWPGNGSRTFFTPLLDGRKYAAGSTNYGEYNNPAVNKLVDKALTAQSLTKVKTQWHAIDVAVMKDAPWVPVYESNSVQFVSARLKNFVFFPFSDNADVTNLWLEG